MTTTTPQVKASHLTKLLASGAEDPVLHITIDADDGTLGLDVWAGALATNVVTHRSELPDWIANQDADADELAACIAELQDTVDELAAEIG